MQNYEFVQEFEENHSGIDYVVGDIHGCFSVLEQALDKIHFNPDVDRLFSVGDLIDRGPESHRCLEFLEKSWFHAIRGNHEQMLIEQMNGTDNSGIWFYNGGSWIWEIDQHEHNKFFEAIWNLPFAIQINGRVKAGIIHADINGCDWDDHLSGLCQGGYTTDSVWSRSRISRFKATGDSSEHNISNVDIVYVGHTPMKKPLIIGNMVYTDTGCCFGNKLTLFKIPSTEMISVSNEHDS